MGGCRGHVVIFLALYDVVLERQVHVDVVRARGFIQW